MTIPAILKQFPWMTRASLGIDRAAWKRELARAFQPILGGTLLPVGAYYAVVVVLHYLTEPPVNFAILGSIAALTSLSAFLVYRRLRGRKAGYVELELLALLIYGLVFSNILVHHLLHLEVHKLVYFLFLTLIIAVTGISLRLIVPAVLTTLATSLWLAGTAGPDVLWQYGFIAFAGSFLSFGLAGLMRIAIKREIHTRLKTEEMRAIAEQAAGHDVLTGLPNRRQFFQRLEEAFARGNTRRNIAVGVIDLNGFKPVNDLYGHIFGDKLLTQVGQRIVRTCGKDTLVARMGGDEFTVLIEQPASEAELAELGADICAAIAETFNIAGTHVAISTSVGFARRTSPAQTPDQLYENADFALYHAKSQGRSGTEVFSAADEQALHNLKAVEYQLRNSDLEAEMYVEFQPQVDITTGRVKGVEALARWANPVLGNIPPDIFIRAAERTGIIGEITPLLLRKALGCARDWPGDFRLSFNLSARDVVAQASIDEICRIVKQSGVSGSRLDFEITETSIMTDFARVRASLKCLQELGAHIALDDFGVGYSNFEHIDELNIHKLKIDRRFVTRLGEGGNTGKIVLTMIEMCANLELECIIEGVETQKELEAVAKAGAKIVQGYYFSRPMPANDVMAFVQKTHAIADGSRNPGKRSAAAV